MQEDFEDMTDYLARMGEALAVMEAQHQQVRQLLLRCTPFDAASGYGPATCELAVWCC